MNDLLGMEKVNTDSTDVGPLIHNLQLGQSHRGVTLTYNLGGIHAWAPPSCMHWKQKIKTGIDKTILTQGPLSRLFWSFSPY